MRLFHARVSKTDGQSLDLQRDAVATAFRALLASRDPLPAPVPALLAYVDDYPRGRPPGAEDAKPSTGVAYAIAIKQLYASHRSSIRWSRRSRPAPRVNGDGARIAPGPVPGGSSTGPPAQNSLR